MSRAFVKFLLPAGLVLTALLMAVCSDASSKSESLTKEDMVERGEYLVTIGGCNDCHTAKIMTDKGPIPDESRALAGHPAGEKLPEIPEGLFGPEGWGGMCNQNMTAWVGPWGVSFAANLTPDQVSGSGAWTETAFVQAMRNGKHLGAGRPILPPMPWQAIGQLSDNDLKAMFAYLHSLPSISNMVPQPLPPSQPQMTNQGD